MLKFLVGGVGLEHFLILLNVCLCFNLPFISDSLYGGLRTQSMQVTENHYYEIEPHIHHQARLMEVFCQFQVSSYLMNQAYGKLTAHPASTEVLL